jgi:branched-chain amino acid aminotransferase
LISHKSFDKVWFNDAVVNRDACLGLDNRAFRYGDGLVETIRLMRGELLFFHDHIERLFHGMHALYMQKPVHWDARFIYECVGRLLTVNNLESSARIRLQVWRTGDGIYAPLHQGVGFFIDVEEASDAYSFNESGLSAENVIGVRKIHDRIANVKTSSMLTYVVAAMEATHKKVDIGFVFNERNMLADAPGRNVFIIEQGKVVTPPLTDACVAGVFRLQLVELLRGHNIVTLEESIDAKRLEHADEIFVTNVVQGIQPVTAYAGKTFSTIQTKELFKLFLNHLRDAG